MITLAITNSSSTVGILPWDGTLPRALGWMTIAASGTVSVVVEAGDMTKPDINNSGFTFGEQLQSLKQRGILTFTATAFGDTAATGSVPDGVIHNT